MILKAGQLLSANGPNILIRHFDWNMLDESCLLLGPFDQGFITATCVYILHVEASEFIYFIQASINSFLSTSNFSLVCTFNNLLFTKGEVNIGEYLPRQKLFTKVNIKNYKLRAETHASARHITVVTSFTYQIKQ